jgi:hypothetical protein
MKVSPRREIAADTAAKNRQGTNYKQTSHKVVHDDILLLRNINKRATPSPAVNIFQFGWINQVRIIL